MNHPCPASPLTERSHSVNRFGFSYLEIQVAMVLLSIGIAGLFSMSVVQTRQTSRLERLLPANDGRGTNEIVSINSVVTADDRVTDWAKKLGVYAETTMTGIVERQRSIPLSELPPQIIDNESSSGLVLYDGGSGSGWVEYVGHTSSYGNSAHQISNADSSGAYAYYLFTSLPEGEYEVCIHVPEKDPSLTGEFGETVEYWVFDENGWNQTLVNQRSIRPDVDYGGRWWQSLGTYYFPSGIGYVFTRDSNYPSDWFIADAVMIRPRRSWQLAGEVTRSANDGASVVVERRN